MYSEAEIMGAFTSIAPEVTSNEIDEVLRNHQLDPATVNGISTMLIRMFTMQQTPPEEAIPASFTIGILVGLRLSAIPVVHSASGVRMDVTKEPE